MKRRKEKLIVKRLWC